MKFCAKCNISNLDEARQTCVMCGGPLDDRPPTIGSADGVTLDMDFTVLVCDHCGAGYSYGNTVCPNCEQPTVGDDGQETAPATDPKVQRRKEALAGVITKVKSLVERLEDASAALAEVNEEDYPSVYAETCTNLLAETNNLFAFISATRFHQGDLDQPETRDRISELVERYRSVLFVARKALEVGPPQNWKIVHDGFASRIKDATKAIAEVLDALTAPNLDEARKTMTRVQATLNEAGSAVGRLSAVATAGKAQRLDPEATLAGAIAHLAVQTPTLSELQQHGVDYFRSALKRDTDELEEGGQFMLTAMAITAESFDNPPLLLKRVEAVAQLLRDADAADHDSLKDVADRIEGELLSAFRWIHDIHSVIRATDFSKLQPRQVLHISIGAYEKFAEGPFDSLLTVLLFADRLVKNDKKDFDAIEGWKLGCKVRKENGGIEASTYPAIAGLAQDLDMVVRHADAHCDFEAHDDRIILVLRDPTGAITERREFTQDVFADLTQRLVEAIYATSAGISVFQIENFEQFGVDIGDRVRDEEKNELWKLIFGRYCVIVDQMEIRRVNKHNRDLFIKLRFHEDVVPYLAGILVPLSDAPRLYQDARNAVVEITDAHGHVLGKLTVPIGDYRKVRGASGGERGMALMLVTMMYRSLVERCRPADIFVPSRLRARTYWQGFLLPVVEALYLIVAEDCLEMEVQGRPAMYRHINSTLAALRLAREVLDSVRPPAEFEKERELASNIVVNALVFLRRVKEAIPDRRFGSLIGRLKRTLEPSWYWLIELDETAKRMVEDTEANETLNYVLWGDRIPREAAARNRPGGK